ncbi:hypothetical protein WN943_002822 [Citrus x changshan-huyou]
MYSQMAKVKESNNFTSGLTLLLIFMPIPSSGILSAFCKYCFFPSIPIMFFSLSLICLDL